MVRSLANRTFQLCLRPGVQRRRGPRRVGRRVRDAEVGPLAEIAEAEVVILGPKFG